MTLSRNVQTFPGWEIGKCVVEVYVSFQTIITFSIPIQNSFTLSVPQQRNPNPNYMSLLKARMIAYMFEQITIKQHKKNTFSRSLPFSFHSNFVLIRNYKREYVSDF